MNSEPRRMKTGTVMTMATSEPATTLHFHRRDQRTTGS